MKKTFPIVMSVLFGIFLLLTLVLCIVRTDLKDASLMGLVESLLGFADKVAGNKTAVPALIQLALSDLAFGLFIAFTLAFCAFIIIINHKISSWFKKVSFPVMIDGAILLIASLTGAILYKAKVSKIMQAMFKNLYSATQKLIIITAVITVVIGGTVLVAGFLKKKKR